MNKRETLLFTAARLIHEKGYNNVGIKAILDEVNVPKGSFYHYFKSKEELGLSIIDFYIADTTNCLNQVEKSIEGINQFFNIFFNRLIELSLKRGCPVGNLILELSDENERFRLKLLEWYNILERWIIEVLEEEKVANSHEKAKALIAAFEGTMLLSKLDKNDVHFEIFNKYTFYSILVI
ncbi:TetR/AcrR family transcriptional regulator [Alkaliphilus hydrothermalis]|uniref:TetR/AcrR family transcriptional repressor of nem operon n=1 Tax=Alkaliphilus hydrothermalis TaxID=1482730 RepID=A0ABS2NRG2_9FIRM|nr:TetR/AcrR family transcriptional regulator [Alkaliphilus hydrothermalis]MBM7615523.1 TetR/AcrR family transcriptional repressor of nem operon [Alkaliphilus hydrothermalis]